MNKVSERALKYYNRGEYFKARDQYQKLLKKSPEKGLIYYNIGLCDFSMHNYELAEKTLSKSMEHGYLSAGYELSMTKLFLNKLEEGLNLYDYRYYGDRESFPNLPLPKAKSLKDLENKRVLVLNEQGFGDEFLFSRSIKTLSNICKSSHYQVYPETLKLFNDYFTQDNITFFTDRLLSGEFVNQFDTWIPSGDIFTYHTLERGFEYTKVDLDRNNIISNTVGLCWNANPKSINAHKRSINPDLIKEDLVNYNVLSLQKDQSLDWIKETTINNFNDTVDIIKSTEEVYTIDTSVMHLSLLFNENTVFLYQKYIDWRWNYPFYGVDVLENSIQL